MDRLQNIISQIRVYAAQNGTTPQAVCRKATGNPFLFDRLMKRDAETDVVIARILALINPGATSTNGNDHNTQAFRMEPVRKDTPDAIGRFDE